MQTCELGGHSGGRYRELAWGLSVDWQLKGRVWTARMSRGVPHLKGRCRRSVYKETYGRIAQIDEKHHENEMSLDP